MTDHALARRARVGALELELGDEVDRVDHAGQLLAGDAQPADLAQADADEDGVELPLQLGERDTSTADAHAAPDLDARLDEPATSRSANSGVILYSATP